MISAPSPWRRLILPEVPWLMPSAFIDRQASMMLWRFFFFRRAKAWRFPVLGAVCAGRLADVRVLNRRLAAPQAAAAGPLSVTEIGEGPVGGKGEDCNRARKIVCRQIRIQRSRSGLGPQRRRLVVPDALRLLAETSQNNTLKNFAGVAARIALSGHRLRGRWWAS